MGRSSLPPLNHDDMISKPGLDLSILGISRRAGFKLKSNILKCRVQPALRLPSERPSCRKEISPVHFVPQRGLLTLSSLILREFTSNLIKLGAIAKLL